MTLHEGVYAALLGPSYETPAEIKYLRTIGADLVGMSTAFEVIAARHMGIKVLAISCVTNMAAGILDQPLSHQEVMETGERVKTSFEALLRAVLPRIQSDRSCRAMIMASLPKYCHPADPNTVIPSEARDLGLCRSGKPVARARTRIPRCRSDDKPL